MNEITKDILKYKSSGKILDLGCGDAPVAISLSKKYFKVTCIDISEKKINKLPKEINGIKTNLNDFKIQENYDIILALGSLHFLSKEKALSLIKDIKAKTNAKGLNIIDAFKSNINAQDLKNIYSKWKILEYEEYKDQKGNEMIYLITQNNL